MLSPASGLLHRSHPKEKRSSFGVVMRDPSSSVDIPSRGPEARQPVPPRQQGPSDSTALAGPAGGNASMASLLTGMACDISSTGLLAAASDAAHGS